MFSGLLSVGCGVELPFTAGTPKFQEGEATGIAQAWLSNCEEHYRSQYLRFGYFRESYMGNGKWQVKLFLRVGDSYGQWGLWEVFEDSLSVHLVKI